MSLLILDFSLLFVKSYEYIFPAIAFIFFFENVNITAGKRFFFLQCSISS